MVISCLDSYVGGLLFANTALKQLVNKRKNYNVRYCSEQIDLHAFRL